MIITQTPLRVSFGGGGTDLEAFWSREPGCVLSTAINKYVYVIVKERFDSKIYLNYSRKEIVDHVDEIQHGLAREAMRMTGVDSGVEMTTLADVPSEGSGLGSSSSILVGLLNALWTLQGVASTAETLAQQACHIECDILKNPIGKQDQYIAAYGNMRFIEFTADGSVPVNGVDISGDTKRELESRLMLFFTGVTREASSILAEQTRITEDKLEQLREMKRQAKDLLTVSTNGCDLDEFGRILDRGWELKKQLAPGITSRLVDEMYRRAKDAGAIGGKLCGAGGGGFLLLYCPPAARSNVRSRLKQFQELPFAFERYGSRVVFNVN